MFLRRVCVHATTRRLLAATRPCAGLERHCECSVYETQQLSFARSPLRTQDRGILEFIKSGEHEEIGALLCRDLIDDTA